MNHPPKTPSQSRGIMQFIRLSWLLFTLVLVLLFLWGLWPFYQHLTSINMDREEILEDLAHAQEIIRILGVSPISYALAQLVLAIFLFSLFIIMGFLIFKKASSSFNLFVAFFMVAMGASMTQSVFTFAFADLFFSSAEFLGILIGDLGWLLFFAFIILFPDGRFVPRLTLFLLLLIWGTYYFNPLPFPTIFGLLLLAVLIQVYRFRHVSSPILRKQTKWVVLGLGLFILGIILTIVIFPPYESPFFFDVLSYLVFPVFPLSVAIAMLRGHLWDVDLVIRKTLLYTVLTTVLAGVYFAVVILLQSLFEAVSGQQSAVSLVISTLIIAALFNPMRGRAQVIIDRRFFRRKYDAQQVLAQFANAARDETDRDQLMAELTRVVQETMQPETVILWLKPGENR